MLHNACLCGRAAAIYGRGHGQRLCSGCDADYDVVLALVLEDDLRQARTIAPSAVCYRCAGGGGCRDCGVTS